jgi:tRNA A-37 threonylcarbamoyl transferase component Bud32
MAVFRELTIKWRGEEYTFVPSMKLMRSIEMGDISFTDIAVRTSQGRPPISHIAFVLAKMLNAAGAKVTDEQVYSELINGTSDEVANLISFVLMAFSPAETDEKKADAQTESQSKARAKASENTGD